MTCPLICEYLHFFSQISSSISHRTKLFEKNNLICMRTRVSFVQTVLYATERYEEFLPSDERVGYICGSSLCIMITMNTSETIITKFVICEQATELAVGKEER